MRHPLPLNPPSWLLFQLGLPQSWSLLVKPALEAPPHIPQSLSDPSLGSLEPDPGPAFSAASAAVSCPQPLLGLCPFRSEARTQVTSQGLPAGSIQGFAWQLLRLEGGNRGGAGGTN